MTNANDLLREIRRHNSSGLTQDMQSRIDAVLAQQAEQVHAKPELIEGRHYTSTCGFGVMTYIGETPDIDGYLPTFRLQDGRTKAYSHANLPRALEEFAQQAEPEKPAPGEQPANNTVTLPRELAEMIERTWRARLPLGQDNVVHGLIRLRLILAQQAEPVEPATAQDEREMTADRAAYLMRRFKSEEKMLGPNEQAAIDYVLGLLSTRPAQTEQQPVRLPERKRTGHLPKEYKTMTVVRAGIEAYNRALDDVAALNAIPIAQTEQHPALYVSAEAFADPEQIGMHATRAPNAVQNMRLYAAPIAQTAPLVVPDECPHIIVFDDADRENEMFAGCGARPAAMRRFEQISQSWNAHLFVRIEKNSRDAPYPCATTAPQPEQSSLVEALECVKLTDEEARHHSVSAVAYWNNAVTACISALSATPSKKESGHD